MVLEANFMLPCSPPDFDKSDWSGDLAWKTSRKFLADFQFRFIVELKKQLALANCDYSDACLMKVTPIKSERQFKRHGSLQCPIYKRSLNNEASAQIRSHPVAKKSSKTFTASTLHHPAPLPVPYPEAEMVIEFSIEMHNHKLRYALQKYYSN